MTPGTETPEAPLPPPTVAVVVITLNEADRLAPALESCRGFADELLVVDSGSRDGTPDLARTLGARVVVHPFSDFADQKNFAMAQVSSSWIFNLDADERASVDLAAAIGEFKRRPPPSLPAGFAIARKSAYLGR
ncbi:MAG TPA: glycosyltransferase family 2 protein, partial [Candidatus Aminicenantes bacterium]|nr:glycosyltransferase family 2 protein [Candidatus Aminicenantes bacterium]